MLVWLVIYAFEYIVLTAKTPANYEIPADLIGGGAGGAVPPKILLASLGGGGTGPPKFCSGFIIYKHLS